ncbi:MAG: CDP-alcohol phosphatidyltransferase family protein [Elusimicrobiota bacterium]
MFTIPNAVTVTRILVTPVFWYLLWSKSAVVDGTLTGLYLLLALGDAVDGILARVLNQKSAVGSVLDPIADKLLIVPTYFIFAVFAKLPIWLALIVVLRDMLIVIGWIVLYSKTKNLQTSPLISGKLSIIFEMLLLALLLLKFPGSVVQVVIVLTVLMIVLSFTEYVFRAVKNIGELRKGVVS